MTDVVTPRPPKQEQLPAQTEVVEVAPNILRMQLPISLPGLGHVNTYALLDKDGVALVDPGLPNDECWDALTNRLAQAGLSVRNVHTVVVTHSHPDHFGGAGRLRMESGANIVGHESFRWAFDTDADVDLDADAARSDDQILESLANHSPPWEKKSRWRDESYDRPKDIGEGPAQWLARMKVWGRPTPTLRMSDGDVVMLADREWVGVHTPGHTVDHLCLFDPTQGVFLSGDHVLPSITPHIGGNADESHDPLNDFFTSLNRMHEFDSLGVKLVLPAHGLEFHDLGGRADAIKHHHEGRLEKLRQASLAEGALSVEQYSHHLFLPRSWGWMADSETFAHLDHLVRIGQASTSTVNGELRFTIPEKTSSSLGRE